MKNNLYKLAWFGVPVIFVIFYALKGEICLMGSCSGDNNLGVAYGVGAAIIYSLILKSQGKGSYWDINEMKRGFLFYVIILVIFAVYFLGKINS